MLRKLDEAGVCGLKDIEEASTLEALERARISVLGKKGALSEVLRSLGSVPAQERPAIGQAANEWKRKLGEAIEARKSRLDQALISAKIQEERIDVSLPSRLPCKGSVHVNTRTMRKIIATLGRLGFDVMTGPEVETEFLNFEAVNIPKDHPARDMQDTFFMGPGVVLRTHTSAIQMRAMRSMSWPLRILCPGAVYRHDSDATHSPMFHQIEALWIDRNVRMSDLKGVLGFFAREIFGPETKIRLRPSYFPFVEPGAEVDVSCFSCKGKPSQDPCRICKDTGWIELLGAGMVHPRLFEMSAFRDVYVKEGLTGFAFGLGVERAAMLLHKIPDMRLLFGNDVRFLSQF